MCVCVCVAVCPERSSAGNESVLRSKQQLQTSSEPCFAREGDQYTGTGPHADPWGLLPHLAHMLTPGGSRCVSSVVVVFLLQLQCRPSETILPKRGPSGRPHQRHLQSETVSLSSGGAAGLGCVTEPLLVSQSGDDLRQDMLTLQVIRIMNKIWIQEGLDMRMVIFRCFSTGRGRGECATAGTPCPLPSEGSGPHQRPSSSLKWLQRTEAGVTASKPPAGGAALIS